MINRREQTNTSCDNGELRCGIDHILEAQQKGEINNDNVLYVVENMNIAGVFQMTFTFKPYI